jgi:hypothetical protein
MLDDSNDGITADEDGAYAIVMTDQEEIDTGRVGSHSIKPRQQTLGDFAL